MVCVIREFPPEWIPVDHSFHDFILYLSKFNFRNLYFSAKFNLVASLFSNLRVINF